MGMVSVPGHEGKSVSRRSFGALQKRCNRRAEVVQWPRKSQVEVVQWPCNSRAALGSQLCRGRVGGVRMQVSC